MHTDTCIETVQHQIGKVVVGKQFKLHLGVKRLKLRQMRHHQQRGGQLRQGNAQQAGRVTVQGANVVCGPLYLAHRRRHPLVKKAALIA
ncbi:hypothetical protein D3C81_1888400 [compost metagenome]